MTQILKITSSLPLEIKRVQIIQLKNGTIRYKDGWVSLTDMAKATGNSSQNAGLTIGRWMRKMSTMTFLAAFETYMENEDFKLSEFGKFKNEAGTNAFNMSPKLWVNQTGAKYIKSVAGRYGGTYAHTKIGIHFAVWLSPEFHLYFINEFERLLLEAQEKRSLEWHVSKLTDCADEMRNLLDTIPGQKTEPNRLKNK